MLFPEPMSSRIYLTFFSNSFSVWPYVEVRDLFGVELVQDNDYDSSTYRYSPSVVDNTVCFPVCIYAFFITSMVSVGE